MAGRSQASFTKRQKERERQERQRQKNERRDARRLAGSQPQPDLPPGVDPDIAGIVPGPQPPPAD